MQISLAVAETRWRDHHTSTYSWVGSEPKSPPSPTLRGLWSTRPAGLRRLQRLVRNKTENRKCRGDPLEFRKRCIFVHGHVRSRSRRSLQVSPQDRCALVGGNLFELDLLTAAAAENCSATGGTYVLDPVHVFSEHGHQVPLPIHDGDHNGQGEHSPGLAPRHLQRSKVVGGDTR
jgi:hypothetical protein